MADVVYDPYSTEIHQDPYPIFTRLRAEHPFTTTRNAASGRSRVTRTSPP
jgi:hypothetical protein